MAAASPEPRFRLGGIKPSPFRPAAALGRMLDEPAPQTVEGSER
jgi:hypothetical protein